MKGLSRSSFASALFLALAIVPSSHADGLRVSGPTSGPATRLRPGQTITIGEGTGSTSHDESHRVVPDTHNVKRGDTLWDICDGYFGDPWQWPRVWSYNPEIVNPHWIYPGELVRLRRGAGIEVTTPTTPTSGGARSPGLALRPKTVTSDTVFLRDQGFLYDNQVEDDGEIAGSPEDKMLLSTHDRVYVKLGKRTLEHIQPGDALTVFQKTRPVRAKSGETVGQVLQILGSVRIYLVDREHELAEGTITETLDVIERGARVGPIERKLHVVAATTNDTELRGEILASVHPNQMYGQNQIVFIDKGESSGLRLGNRLFVVRKGDPWQEGLSATGQLTAQKVTLSVDGPAEVSTTRSEALNAYPEEIVAEIRVIALRKTTATSLVTISRRELVPGDVWVAKKGY